MSGSRPRGCRGTAGWQGGCILMILKRRMAFSLKLPADGSWEFGLMLLIEDGLIRIVLEAECTLNLIFATLRKNMCHLPPSRCNAWQPSLLSDQHCSSCLDSFPHSNLDITLSRPLSRQSVMTPSTGIIFQILPELQSLCFPTQAENTSVCHSWLETRGKKTKSARLLKCVINIRRA